MLVRLASSGSQHTTCLSCILQVFGDERTAVIDGLPSLEESSDHFQTQSNGPATASLEDMQQGAVPHLSHDSSSDDEEQAQDMDHTELPEPKAPKPTSGQSSQSNDHAIPAAVQGEMFDCICSI